MPRSQGVGRLGSPRAPSKANRVTTARSAETRQAVLAVSRSVLRRGTWSRAQAGPVKQTRILTSVSHTGPSRPAGRPAGSVTQPEIRRPRRLR
nr:hypothetical protein GCM10020092_095970 [Actinoplanes digitatis]